MMRCSVCGKMLEKEEAFAYEGKTYCSLCASCARGGNCECGCASRCRFE